MQKSILYTGFINLIIAETQFSINLLNLIRFAGNRKKVMKNFTLQSRFRID